MKYHCCKIRPTVYLLLECNKYFFCHLFNFSKFLRHRDRFKQISMFKQNVLTAFNILFILFSHKIFVSLVNGLKDMLHLSRSQRTAEVFWAGLLLKDINKLFTPKLSSFMYLKQKFPRNRDFFLKFDLYPIVIEW